MRDLHASSDAELMATLCQGDDRGLVPLIDRYAARVRTYLGHVVRDGTWADDLTQEVFVRVFESAASYDDHYAFSVWLFRIARNLGVDLMRKQGTQQKAIGTLKRRIRENQRGPIPGGSSTPLQDLESREFLQHFELALERLAEPFRSVFVLREVEGMSYEEIATVVGVSAKTVSTRLHRARKQLRRLLASYLDPENAGSRPAVRDFHTGEAPGEEQ